MVRARRFDKIIKKEIFYYNNSNNKKNNNSEYSINKVDDFYLDYIVYYGYYNFFL